MSNDILYTNGETAPDTYTLATESEPATGDVILPVDKLASLAQLSGKKGVILSADHSPEVVELPLDDLDMIAIHFESFNDGRGYSFARILRRQGFTGELRAVGDIFQDTLFYMKRAGFDSFALKDGKLVETAANGLHDFSAGYQASQTQTQAHFQVGQGATD